MKVGIIFGGPSREREISFAGGRTVYDNLDKSLFQPVPLFVDSHKNLIRLDWPFLYKGTIRDFYPPVSHLPKTAHAFQLYIESLKDLEKEAYTDLIQQVGHAVPWDQLPDVIDFAFLALHGEFGEDGQIQAILESMEIPYSGSGIMASAIGMDKSVQKKLMRAAGFACPEMVEISRSEWLKGKAASFFQICVEKIGLPFVIRPANQGSSIGVSIVGKESTEKDFTERIDKAFFRKKLSLTDWAAKKTADKVQFVRDLSDIREGLGFPLSVQGQILYRPDELLTYLDELSQNVTDVGEVTMEAYFSEQKVIVESFIHGREFSCIVLRKEDNSSVALPPTEIVKGAEVFDYRSKYLPGLARKETPIQLPSDKIRNIQKTCEALFEYLAFKCYARIDGFIQEDGTIYLNDPNTTSGMMPSSFFFHQAAEIGLNPSQFLTYILRCSLMERSNAALSGFKYQKMLAALDNDILHLKKETEQGKKKVAVILGGYSFERHISMESGRNIFEKLSSSPLYEPIPVFLTGSDDKHVLYRIPINLLLKDNADDIRDKIEHFSRHEIIEETKQKCQSITSKYASQDVVFEPTRISYEELGTLVDLVFIALHGRPGEDGAIQQHLERVGLPYNGSGIDSSQTTIHKYNTLQALKANGFKVAMQDLWTRFAYRKDPSSALLEIKKTFGFPLVAKPVDDGCSSAVKVIRNEEQLRHYLDALFRDTPLLSDELRQNLGLKWNEEFPQKKEVLLEELITAEGAEHFLEITGGMLTHYSNGKVIFEVFEPSEALAGGEVLSLEEKFLAGEGQNITPARYASDPVRAAKISAAVRQDLEKAAKILGVEGYCRIDAFVRIFADERVETIIIEVNSLPGMTPATCIFHQCAINGYQPHDFIHKILTFAEERQRATLA